MATVATAGGQAAIRERPEDPVPPTTVLGYLLDAVMIFVQFVAYAFEVLFMLMLPFLLLLGLFPLMFACALVVVVLGSILHAFHLA